MTELDNLAGAAAAADATAATLTPVAPGDEAASPQPEVAAVPGPDEQAADLVNMFAGLVVSYAPAAAEVWTEENRKAAAAVMAPVMVKYGFSMAVFPPELAAAIVVGPLLYRSSTIVAEKIRADRAAKAPVGKQLEASTKPTPVEAPSGPDGAPAAGVHEQLKLYAAA